METIRKTYCHRPARMMVAPLTIEDIAILNRRSGCMAMARLSVAEADRLYHGERTPCPPQFESLPILSALNGLREALEVCDRSPTVPAVLALLDACRNILRILK